MAAEAGMVSCCPRVGARGASPPVLLCPLEGFTESRPFEKWRKEEEAKMHRFRRESGRGWTRYVCLARSRHPAVLAAAAC